MDLNHLEWPFFDDEHRRLAESFAQWTPLQLSRYENAEGGDGIAAREIFQHLAQDGWLNATAPIEPESDVIDLRRVCLLREIAAYSSAMADVALSEPWLGLLPIIFAASPDLKGHYVSRYLRGELVPAFALSEPDAGSDAAAITTTAHRDGTHYVLNGRKTWTSNAGLADLYVVFARLETSEAAGGISAFAVEREDGGIILEERLNVLPPHTVGTWRLADCRVPAERLLGRPGAGFRIAMRSLEMFRPSVGAATLGFARRAAHEALSRSVSRTAFRKPISEHQLVQAKLADMAVKIDASALLVYKAAWCHDKHRSEVRRDAAIAKLFSTEAAHQVIDEAVQIFGGRGLVNGETVERLYRHARAFRIFDGTSEIQRLIIARELLRKR
jgi:acyl-CoA dehydrogenase